MMMMRVGVTLMSIKIHLIMWRAMLSPPRLPASWGAFNAGA